MLTKEKIAALEPKLAARGISDEDVDLIALLTDKIQVATHQSVKPDAAMQAATSLVIARPAKK